MSAILAIEAATGRCSVALLREGACFERHHDVPREHARHLLRFVDEVLGEAGIALADLDALAVGRGPGSFTGVRAAIATVQGLALGSGLPVIAESTLRVLAATAGRVEGHENVIALLDARMGEVYAAAFEAGREVMAEQLQSPEALALPEDWSRGADWVAVGSGLGYAGRLPAAILEHAPDGAEDLQPAAEDLARMAQEALAAGRVLRSPAELQPVYLRDRVVHVAPNKPII